MELSVLVSVEKAEEGVAALTECPTTPLMALYDSSNEDNLTPKVFNSLNRLLRGSPSRHYIINDGDLPSRT